MVMVGDLLRSDVEGNGSSGVVPCHHWNHSQMPVCREMWILQNLQRMAQLGSTRYVRTYIRKPF